MIIFYMVCNKKKLSLGDTLAAILYVVVSNITPNQLYYLWLDVKVWEREFRNLRDASHNDLKRVFMFFKRILISRHIFFRYHRLSTTSIYFHGTNLLPKVETHGEISSLFFPLLSNLGCEAWIWVHSLAYCQDYLAIHALPLIPGPIVWMNVRLTSKLEMPSRPKLSGLKSSEAHDSQYDVFCIMCHKLYS